MKSITFKSETSFDERPSLATDWRIQEGTRQSGLRYFWQDGLPIIPQATLGRRLQFGVKRAVDIVGSLCGIVALSPLLVAIAIAIKFESPGPILFRQSRTGKGGWPFDIFKFRTMFEHKCDASGTVQTVADDERVTPLGRVLRSKSIDELPQLLNVLRGEMSLVGPRPHVPNMLAGGVTYETLVPYYPLRNVVKPGITGWAQANGYRGPTHGTKEATARIDHDLAYVQNFSLWLDAGVLALTVWRELTRGTGV